MTHHIEGDAFNFQPIKDRLLIGVAAVINNCAKDVALITATWQHKPKFTISYPQYRAYFETRGRIRASISTTDKRWIWVTEGTRRHRIPKSGSKRMHFRRVSLPKTSPGVIGSAAGSRAGPWQHPTKVMHPGIRPRKFFETIAVRRLPDLKREVEWALGG